MKRNFLSHAISAGIGFGLLRLSAAEPTSAPLKQSTNQNTAAINVAAAAEPKDVESRLAAYLKRDYPCKITSVHVLNDRITIEADARREPGELYLCEVPLYQSVAELKTFDHTTALKGRQGRFTMDLERYRALPDRRYDRIFSKWAIARRTASGFELVSHARYPDEVTARWNLPEEKPRSKKGLGGVSVGGAPLDDLDELGIHNITVNIVLDGFLGTTPDQGRFPFEFDGKTYYADKRAVAQLDAATTNAARRGIIVSAILLVSHGKTMRDQTLAKSLPHPDAAAGHFAMPNVASAEGLECYAAGLNFLAERYSQPDKQYGRIHHWIIHNEVDAGWEWTNAGEKTAVMFMDLYHKSMRTAYYVARKYNPHAKVFISLTHYWNETENPHFYLPKQLLEILLDFSRAEGDFEWAIAQHPYPQSLAEPRVWDDKKTDFTFNTPLITFRNLEVLDAWMKQPRTFFRGVRQRTLHLSEQGLNSRDYTVKSLQDQAAGMAYAWKKIERLNSVEAFHYHNWVDNRFEGGLRIGLRKFRDDPNEPFGKKPVWHVYQKLETPEEDQACEFAKPIIGIKDWEEIQHKGPIVTPSKD